MPHARCSRCESRRTLARFPAEYVRLPRCRRCGSNRYRVDEYRRTKERAPHLTCTPGRTGCTGYHFPHRRGSKFCIFNPHLSAEDIAVREGFDTTAIPFDTTAFQVDAAPIQVDTALLADCPF